MAIVRLLLDRTVYPFNDYIKVAMSLREEFFILKAVIIQPFDKTMAGSHKKRKVSSNLQEYIFNIIKIYVLFCLVELLYKYSFTNKHTVILHPFLPFSFKSTTTKQCNRSTDEMHDESLTATAHPLDFSKLVIS